MTRGKLHYQDMIFKKRLLAYFCASRSKICGKAVIKVHFSAYIKISSLKKIIVIKNNTKTLKKNIKCSLLNLAKSDLAIHIYQKIFGNSSEQFQRIVNFL